MDSREEWSFNVDAYTARLIGRENVARLEGAIMELVKNAYDADANCFCIYYSFELSSLFLIDNGTGMSRDTIRDYWMTIGNSSKKEHYLSAKKRIQTGAKGIGRFALDRIADHSEMLTIQNGQGITWTVNWNEFNEKKQLTDVKASVRNSNKKLYEHIGIDIWPNHEMAAFIRESFAGDGTAFVLTGFHDEWNVKQLKIIRNSLENMFPYEIKEKGFSVYFFEDNTSLEDAEIIDKQVDNYDYKIHFEVVTEKDGEDVLCIQIQRNEYDFGSHMDEIMEDAGFSIEEREWFKGKPKEIKIRFSDIGELSNLIGTFNGTLYFNKVTQNKDDREKYYYKDITGRRNFVKEFGGIKIYRDFFRVRPYGENETGEFDWLKLAERSAMSPAGVGTKGAWRVNANQMMGVIHISRTNTNLEDAANRNGIQDGEGFEQLKRLLKQVILCFEQDRQGVARKLARYYDEQHPENTTREKIKYVAKEEEKGRKTKEKLSARAVNEYVEILEKKHQEEIEDLQDENRMLQTLATAGIVTNVFMHEIRTLMNNIGLDMDSAYDAIVLDHDLDYAQSNIRNAIENKKSFASWFAITIDSVRKDKRKRKKVNISDALGPFVHNWHDILLRQNVILNYQCDEELAFRCFAFDIENIISNLITNSLASFERETGELLDKTEIKLDISATEHGMIIQYEDTGWGLIPRYKEQPELILEAFESDRGVTAEEEGTGMGMWIVHKTVSEYKGSIQLESNKKREKGFEISIILGEANV